MGVVNQNGGCQWSGELNGAREILSLDALREIRNLDAVAERRLKEHGWSGIDEDGVGSGEVNEYEAIGSGSIGNNSSLALKGKKSGLDIVKNDCVVMFPQRCPHTYLKNEYAASSNLLD